MDGETEVLGDGVADVVVGDGDDPRSPGTAAAMVAGRLAGTLAP
jgi:hypothetical protein